MFTIILYILAIVFLSSDKSYDTFPDYRPLPHSSQLNHHFKVLNS